MSDNDWVDVPQDDWVDVSADELKDDGPTPLGSAFRKALSGASLGFSDELAGGLEALGAAAGVSGLGGPMKNIELSKEGPTTKLDVLKKAYENARNREREALAKDATTNPKASFLGELGGSIISPANKVAGGLAQGFGKGGLALSGAALGGTTGLGQSSSESISGNIADTAVGAGLGGALGFGGEKLGGILDSGAKKAAELISPASSKANRPAIEAAAKNLGIEATPGMLDGGGFLERLESSLAKSPTIAGQKIAKKLSANEQKMVSEIEGLTKNATNMSDYQVGEKVKSDLTSKIHERLDPLQAVFQDVAESTRHIPLRERSVDAVKRNIGNIDEVKLLGGGGKGQQYVDMLSRVENVDQLKKMMTLLNSDIQSSMGSDKMVLSAIKDKLSRLEDNSIIRSAIETAKSGGMRSSTGEAIGSEIINDLSAARKGYRSLAEDLSKASESAGIKFKGGPTSFMNKVENIPSEKISDKFLNLENTRQSQNMEKLFPDVFETLKSSKMRDVLAGSKNSTLSGHGGIESARFLKEFGKLQPEAQQTLFGEGLGKIADIQTIKNAVPKNFNPSGTAGEIAFNNPIMANVKDAAKYLLYKGAASNAGQNLGKTDLTGVASGAVPAGVNLLNRTQRPDSEKAYKYLQNKRLVSEKEAADNFINNN